MRHAVERGKVICGHTLIGVIKWILLLVLDTIRKIRKIWQFLAVEIWRRLYINI